MTTDYIVIDDSELFNIPEDIEKEFQKKLKELEKTILNV